MNGYMQIRVMAGGRYADCWQQIENGQVVGFVDDDCKPVSPPEPHEAHCLTGQLYFAPGILEQPADPEAPAGPSPRPLFGETPADEAPLLGAPSQE